MRDSPRVRVRGCTGTRAWRDHWFRRVGLDADLLLETTYTADDLEGCLGRREVCRRDCSGTGKIVSELGTSHLFPLADGSRLGIPSPQRGCHSRTSSTRRAVFELVIDNGSGVHLLVCWFYASRNVFLSGVVRLKMLGILAFGWYCRLLWYGSVL